MKRIILFLPVFSSFIQAGPITVHNESGETIYAAVYQVPPYPFTKSAQRFGLPIEIPYPNQGTLERPSFNLTKNRELAVSYSKDALKQSLTAEQFALLHSFNIGLGTDFYIALREGQLKGYDYFSWKTLKPIETIVTRGKKKITGPAYESFRKAYGAHPHVNQQAVLRLGTELSAGEQEYIAKRLPRIKVALENLLETELTTDEVPRIAFCASGGGYRAMISTIGMLSALQKSKLLDTIMYLAGLSGSTWAIGSWMYWGGTIADLQLRLQNRINTNLLQSTFTHKDMASLWYRKYIFGQPLSLVDIYGELLGHKLLGSAGSDVGRITLSSQQERVASAEVPYPIYTAIVTKQPYEWVEFTPHEVGSNYLGGYVPSWGFGRQFKRGRSTDFAPEQSLGFLMGIWGSAFTVNIKEAFNFMKDQISNKALRNAIESTTETVSIGGARLLPAKVFNFTAGMPQSPRAHSETLSLIDAGISFNLPIPPLTRLERKIDILIILDASAGQEVGGELRKTEQYMKARGLAFPEIDYSVLGSNTISIFDTNPYAPIVIYIPLIANPEYDNFDPRTADYTGTFNLQYTPEQFQELSGLMEFTTLQHQEKILDVIKCVIFKRKFFKKLSVE